MIQEGIVIQPKKERSYATVVTCDDLAKRINETDELTTEEEKVLRMRYGLPLEGGTPLGLVTNDPDVAERIAQLESIALARLGGHLPPSIKDQIVSRLRSKRR